MIKDFTKEEIDEAFDKTEVITSMLNLFKKAYPDWDNIVQLHHFPKVSKTTDFYMLDRFTDLIQRFPEENPTRQQFMMIWLNKGFGIDEKLEDWKVFTEPEKIEYLKGKENVENTQ
jgi:hypothetical protein